MKTFSLKDILSYSNIDLFHCNNDAIEIANISGNIEIVKLFLQDHRVYLLLMINYQ
jgi:hypothetical protein